MILSVEVRAMKPEPAIYRLTLDRLGVEDASRAVFVDDQTSYCDGAAAVGLQTYLILRPEEAAEGRPANLDGLPHDRNPQRPAVAGQADR